MMLGGGSITGGSGAAVAIREFTDGTPIDLGASTDTGFALSNTELATVTTTGVLRIGDANSGEISATTTSPQATAPNLRLTSGEGIAKADAVSITASPLALHAAGVINVNTAVRTSPRRPPAAASL